MIKLLPLYNNSFQSKGFVRGLKEKETSILRITFLYFMTNHMGMVY